MLRSIMKRAMEWSESQSELGGASVTIRELENTNHSNCNYRLKLVAGAGFEPTTFGL
ncbi:hypothetical protein H8Q53_000902 [Vibrio parahaemolyticus]|nr:hypothetical protein [Vibrio parahaemolyticus]